MMRRIYYFLLVILIGSHSILLFLFRNTGQSNKRHQFKNIARLSNWKFHSKEVMIKSRKSADNGLAMEINRSMFHQTTPINLLAVNSTIASRTALLEAKTRKSPDLIPGRKDPLLLLMWHHPWELTFEGPREGTKAADCTITYDRSKLREASAVIFHFAVLDKEPMPWTHYRHPDQLFIYYTMENPSFLQFAERRTSTQFDGHFINWTMSYRRDSDVFSSYFTGAKEILKDGKKEVDKILAKKSNVALWVVSNCLRLPGAVIRMQFVNELLKAGLPVHRYGSCFRNKEKFAELSPETLDSYKFYLAFENSVHCRDYITEKLWTNGFKLGRVPVVWGTSKADVAALAPPGSYIHAEDFGSPALLARYLIYLDKNATAYSEYFNWRVKPSEEVKRILSKHYLIGEEQLCDKLHKGFKRKTIESISHWMFGTESKECLQPFR